MTPLEVRHARVLTARDILGRGIAIWGRNFLRFAIVSAVIHAPLLALVIGQPSGVHLGSDGPTQRIGMEVVSIALGLLTSGVIAEAVGISLQGGHVTVVGCLRRLFVHPLTLVATGFTIWLLVLLYLVVAALCCLGVWAAAQFMDVDLGRSAIFGWGAVGANLLALGLATARFWVAIPVAAVEGPSPSYALQRSRELLQGSALPVLVAVLVIGGSLVLIGLGLAYLLPRGDGNAIGSIEEAAERVHTFFLLLSLYHFLVVAPLLAVASAVTYHRLAGKLSPEK